MLAALPLLMAVVCFMVFCGRVGIAHLDLAAAASAAARGASLERSPAAATAAAQAAAELALAGKDVTCARLAVAVDTTRFTPGGQVTVALSCQLTTQDLVGLGTLGLVVVDAAATSPVDSFRALPTGLTILDRPFAATADVGGGAA